MLVPVLLGRSGPQRSGPRRGCRRWSPRLSPLWEPRGPVPAGRRPSKSGGRGSLVPRATAPPLGGRGERRVGGGGRPGAGGGGGSAGGGGAERGRAGRVPAEWGGGAVGSGSPNSQHLKVTAARGGAGSPRECLLPPSPAPHPGCAGSVLGPRQAWLWAGAAPINGSLGRRPRAQGGQGGHAGSL